MARETPLTDKLLLGALGATAGLVVGRRVYRYCRDRWLESRRTHIVCTECGEALPVGDVLDPTVTCACVAVNDHGDSPVR